MTTVEHVAAHGKSPMARTIAARDRWVRAPLVVAYHYGKTVAPSGTPAHRDGIPADQPLWLTGNPRRDDIGASRALSPRR